VTKSRLIFIGVLLVLIGIQYIPVEKSNPPALSDIETPMAVKIVFTKSCYDCHSNETKWPWYSKVAPISWLVAEDVNEGRKHLNFSDWERYTTDKQHKLLQDIIEEIESDEMPLGAYTVLHPGARLDEMKKELLKQWMKN